MSYLFTDVILITPITVDANFGTETEGVAVVSKAYVEDQCKIRYNAAGQPMEPDIVICLPKGTEIAEGDYIQITFLHGQTPTAGEGVRRKVKMVSRVGAFNISHIEVIV